MEFDGGGVPRSLFLGDLSAAPQRVLARSTPLSDYAVVKVAHHGSADQDAALYEALDPTVAVFSAGAGNDYGHPRADALRMLEGLGTRIARTDMDGLVLVGTTPPDGAPRLTLWRDRSPPGVGGAE
jgi:competence protein ComEC